MKSPSAIIILIVVTIFSTALRADEWYQVPPITIPADRKKEADATYASGLQYYIWPATNSPITSIKIGGLGPGGTGANGLLIPLKFRANVDAPEFFCVEVETVVKRNDSAASKLETNNFRMCDPGTEGKANGRTIASYLPISQAGLMPGKGEATIHLVKKSDLDKPDAKAISNKAKVKIVVEP
jgi:hypothetical protein